MPHKDPEKAAENNRKRQKAFKDRQRAAKLRGEEPASPAAAVLRLISNESDAPPSGAPQSAQNRGPMTNADWARAKVALGNKLCNLSSKALDAAMVGKSHPLGPRDAGTLLRLGIELINANLSILQPTEGPKRGNLEQENAEWLRDEEYRRIMTEGLKRKQALQSEKPR